MLCVVPYLKNLYELWQAAQKGNVEANTKEEIEGMRMRGGNFSLT
jgi:hypothetical protein